MGKFDKKGSYAGYDRNNKEREALDYYATPIEEVKNILDILDISFINQIILEPCAGGGNMVQGILDYVGNWNTVIYATEIKERGFSIKNNKVIYKSGNEQDFFSDNYGNDFPQIDYIIMNPPYSVIEPFVMKALEIANKGVLMLGRLQFLEGEKRFNNIIKDNPPTDVYVYVDRIKCYKNGDPSISTGAIQAYAWFYWDMQKESKESSLHWIRRADKKGK